MGEDEAATANTPHERGRRPNFAVQERSSRAACNTVPASASLHFISGTDRLTRYDSWVAINKKHENDRRNSKQSCQTFTALWHANLQPDPCDYPGFSAVKTHQLRGDGVGPAWRSGVIVRPSIGRRALDAWHDQHGAARDTFAGAKERLTTPSRRCAECRRRRPGRAVDMRLFWGLTLPGACRLNG